MSELHRFVHTAVLRDGSQLMIESWVDADGVTQKMSAATRATTNQAEVWGAPVELVPD